MNEDYIGMSPDLIDKLRKITKEKINNKSKKYKCLDGKGYIDYLTGNIYETQSDKNLEEYIKKYSEDWLEIIEEKQPIEEDLKEGDTVIVTGLFCKGVKCTSSNCQDYDICSEAIGKTHKIIEKDEDDYSSEYTCGTESNIMCMQPRKAFKLITTPLISKNTIEIKEQPTNKVKPMLACSILLSK